MRSRSRTMMTIAVKKWWMGNKRGHIPTRTCISCGAKRTKGELIRIVLDSNGVARRDISRKAKGRGAHICSNASCLEILKSSNRLNRAFKRDVLLVNDF